MLDEAADRTTEVDLDRAWRERSERFRAGEAWCAASVRVREDRRDELAESALAVLAETSSEPGWLWVEVRYQDDRHARWALWRLGLDVEVLEPASLRADLRGRALTLAARYAET